MHKKKKMYIFLIFFKQIQEKFKRNLVLNL